MSELLTLARPYAAAAFRHAKETSSADKWSQFLAVMAAVLTDANLSSIVDNPKVSNRQLVELLLDIGQGQIHQEGENFIKLLVENGRLRLLPNIHAFFEECRAQDEGYVDVDVSVAYGFDDESWGHFVQSLERKLGKSVRIHVSVDKSLIGGVLVRAGDKVFDGSIKGRLQHMHKTLK